MEKTHWRTLYESGKYAGAYEFKPGQKITVTISKVVVESMIDPEGKKEKNPVLYFEESSIKPIVMNKTNARRIQKVTGSPAIEDWIGKKFVFDVEMEKAFGEIQPVLRINIKLSKAAQAGPTLNCVDCGKPIQPFGDKPVTWVAQYTKEKFGVVLCIECGKKRQNGETCRPANKQDSDLEIHDTLSAN